MWPGRRPRIRSLHGKAPPYLTRPDTPRLPPPVIPSGSPLHTTSHFKWWGTAVNSESPPPKLETIIRNSFPCKPPSAICPNRRGGCRNPKTPLGTPPVSPIIYPCPRCHKQASLIVWLWSKVPPKPTIKSAPRPTIKAAESAHSHRETVDQTQK